MDLEGIEQACVAVAKGYASQEQVILLKEAIIKERETNQLGISSSSHKENRGNLEDPSKKTRGKSNKWIVAKAGRLLLKLG